MGKGVAFRLFRSLPAQQIPAGERFRFAGEKDLQPEADPDCQQYAEHGNQCLFWFLFSAQDAEQIRADKNEEEFYDKVLKKNEGRRLVIIKECKVRPEADIARNTVSDEQPKSDPCKDRKHR